MPFSEARVTAAAVENNLRFPGQYFDEETGLHYNWNRYYDPETGRYITADPIGLGGGINLYAYVSNDPTNLFDPDGKSATAIAGGWIATDASVPDPTDAAWPKWVGYGLGLSAAGAIDWAMSESTEDQPCENGDEETDSLDDYPADPDDWNPPEGWEETVAGERTGGKHRQWRGPNGELRRWDREGREGGIERGPHWHDPRYPGSHIPPNR